MAVFDFGLAVYFEFYYSGKMEIYEAADAFASLSQETRLRVFRLLIQYGSDGLVPGKIASQLKIPNNTLSFHLAHMSQAGLVTSKKNGRSITYCADTGLIEQLIDYMRENCCTRGKKRKC